MDRAYLKKLVSTALSEDIKTGDITTRALFPRAINVTAEIIAKENGVVCGMSLVEDVFKKVGKKIKVYNKVKDGAFIKKGQALCVIRGNARAILTAERTALNFLGRLSGIATLTREYVNKVKPYKVKIMDTRKTTPGLRQLEKYAVKIGGGYNHRMGLWDQVLVKDNHFSVLRHAPCVLRMKDLIECLRKRTGKKIEIEVENLQQFKKALTAGPEVIMLDNMNISDIRKAVNFKSKRNTQYAIRNTLLEVSGGVTLVNVREIAMTGIDMVSIGALTHSSRALDVSLEIQ